MTKIVVDVEALRRMVDWLSASGEDMSLWGKSLLNATSDARSYDGQYAPWVQALADEANHDINAYIHEVKNLSRRLEKIAKAFEDADQAELAGDFAWALIMREMVERGEIPTGDWFQWRQTISRPPWISPAVWRRLNREERAEIVLAARRAYDAQNERIARLRTPPWEKDPGWLWIVAGINPQLLENRYFPDMEIAGIREYKRQLRLEYEQHWSNFLANQAVYKFGVGDDLTEAFLIYMFGLEGAAEYGVEVFYSKDGNFSGAVVAEDQRILENPIDLIRDYIGGVHVQDIKLEAIEGLEGSYAGIVHKNLCGQITSAVTIGVDPIDALIEFEGVPDGSAILSDPSMGTNPTNLIKLLEEYGWEGQAIGYASDPEPWKDYPPTMDNLHDYLCEGKAILPLTNINTSTGFLEPGDIGSDAAHWPSVLQTIKTHNGEEIVRVYNPYENREEWIRYDDYQSSWQLYSKYNRSGKRMGPNYRAVIATPPEELQWLPNP